MKMYCQVFYVIKRKYCQQRECSLIEIVLNKKLRFLAICNHNVVVNKREVWTVEYLFRF